MDIDKWADRIYLEEDFGKNIATTVSGFCGLTIYLIKNDFPLSAFVTIIVFPITKIIVNFLRSRHFNINEAKERENALKAIDKTVKDLTDRERLVVHEFVKYQSSVMSHKYISINSVYLPDGAVKSLIERDFLTEQSSGLSGSFDLKLNMDIFDAGRRYFERQSKS